MPGDPLQELNLQLALLRQEVAALRAQSKGGPGGGTGAGPGGTTPMAALPNKGGGYNTIPIASQLASAAIVAGAGKIAGSILYGAMPMSGHTTDSAMAAVSRNAGPLGGTNLRLQRALLYDSKWGWAGAAVGGTLGGPAGGLAGFMGGRIAQETFPFVTRAFRGMNLNRFDRIGGYIRAAEHIGKLMSEPDRDYMPSHRFEGFGDRRTYQHALMAVATTGASFVHGTLEMATLRYAEQNLFAAGKDIWAGRSWRTVDRRVGRAIRGAAAFALVEMAATAAEEGWDAWSGQKRGRELLSQHETRARLSEMGYEGYAGGKVVDNLAREELAKKAALGKFYIGPEWKRIAFKVLSIGLSEEVATSYGDRMAKQREDIIKRVGEEEKFVAEGKRQAALGNKAEAQAEFMKVKYLVRLREQDATWLDPLRFLSMADQSRAGRTAFARWNNPRIGLRTGD